MNKVKCQACGEIACVIIPRWKLNNLFAPKVGCMTPIEAAGLISLIKEGVKFFDRKYLHCEKCGDLRELP